MTTIPSMLGMGGIGFCDLEFAEAPVMLHGSRGTPYTVRRPVGMPRIPQKLLDCVVYLYRDEQSARDGNNCGGTGFLIGVLSKYSDSSAFCYVVSNWHVACQNHSTVRINTKDGKFEIFEFDNTQWEFNPDTQTDIAVTPVALRSDTHKYSLVTTSMFVTKELFVKEEIGPGDDVFMAGRFIDHEGTEQNSPSVRFGNISMNPSLVPQCHGLPEANAYCIDIHSRSGYSGSPVFVYRTPGHDLTAQRPKELTLETEMLVPGPKLFALLGIHYGQFPEIWEVTDKGKLIHQSESEPLITGNKFIKGLSGMTCVLPAWSILEVLDMPKVKDSRDAADEEVKRRIDQDTTIPNAETEDDTHPGDEALKQILNIPPKPRR